MNSLLIFWFLFIGFSYKHFLSSSSYYFDLGSTLWNWIAVLGTYSIFAFSFSFSSSLYSWQSCCYVPFYLFDINRFLIIPLWTSFKIIVFSFDVIHSLGFYCFGIKIDAIPGRINLASTLRSLFKGEHRGFCFELCGQGHSSMLIVGLILTFTYLYFCSILFSIFIILCYWNLMKEIDSMSLSLSLIWVSGWVILSCSMIEGFLGYILNWGQMSYWGIIVMINLLSILPLFGLMIAELIWCSCNVIINRIFVLHFSLGFLIGCFIFVHLFVLHSFSSSNPLLNSFYFWFD